MATSQNIRSVPEQEVTPAPAQDVTPAPVRAIPAERLYSVAAIHAERERRLRDRYGGFSWGADFLGFAVANFFTVVFLAIVGGIVGAVGYQLGAPVPKVGSALSPTSQTLGWGGLVGALIALALAYFLGGYAAGRMARFDGAKNGIGVVLWAILVGIILGIIGAILGTRFNVAGQLHLNIDPATLTVAGVISLLVTLLVMFVAAALGGRLGAAFHRAIDRNAGLT